MTLDELKTKVMATYNDPDNRFTWVGPHMDSYKANCVGVLIEVRGGQKKFAVMSLRDGLWDSASSIIEHFHNWATNTGVSDYLAKNPQFDYRKSVENKAVVCECGAEKCKTTHAFWCPKHIK